MRLFKKKNKYKKSTLAYFLLLLFAGLLIRERGRVLQTTAGGAIDQLAQADCGVVLTGSARRIREAFEVLNSGKVSRLIISGVYKDTQLHEIFPQLPDYPEISADHIILEKVSGSTHQNAVQSLLVVQDLKCKSILLMTSQLHMYRAYRTFKANFPDDIEIRPYPIVNSLKEETELAVLFEAIKSLFYSLMPLIQGHT